MTTTETAKLIKQELKQLHPEIKFSVRKVHPGTIWVSHNISDLEWQVNLQQFLRKFEGWDNFRTEYVFEQYAA